MNNERGDKIEYGGGQRGIRGCRGEEVRGLRTSMRYEGEKGRTTSYFPY